MQEKFFQEKVVNSLSEDSFVKRRSVLFGEECLLIYPKKVNPEWSDENKVFRSALLNKENIPISLGFKKFTNFGEKPNFEPLDTNSTLTFVTKKDGSLLIISKYRGNLIIRTRGTTDATFLANGTEIEYLKAEYPALFDNETLNKENCSILCEWTSPSNVIILNETEKPDLWLIGLVSHDDYSYLGQKDLDDFAHSIGVKRPKSIAFGDIGQCQRFCKDDRSIEGCVVYSENGQILKKIKTDFYVSLHRLRFSLSKDAMLKLYLDSGAETVQAFRTYLISLYDYEVISGLGLEKLEKADLELKEKEGGLRKLAKEIENLPRKRIAESIFNLVPKNDHKFAFSVVDKGKIDDKLREDFIRKRL